MYARLISPLKNQQGVSLAEGLVSVGAIAGLAALIATLSTQTDTRSYTLKRSCDSLATSITEAVADEGVYSDIYGITPGHDTITPDPDGGGTYPTEMTSAEGSTMIAAAPGQVMDVVQPGDMYPGTAFNLIGAGPTPVVETYRMIKGSVAAMNAIYNSADMCTTFTTYPNFSNIAAGEITALGLTSELFQLPTNPVIEVQLVVRRPDGTEDCPARPYYIRPAGAIDLNNAFDAT
ncbi:MAG: hypothetical protein AAF329_29045, partial [Cyanobacteria bacterium P01_A01_bin.17]